MFVDRPLRSGQRVYARGGDLVVLGLVSHGAEVIADGNIHVYGPLRGRAIAGAITALMTGTSYKTSAEMAGELGAFQDYERNAPHMLRVMRNHRRAARDAPGVQPPVLPQRDAVEGDIGFYLSLSAAFRAPKGGSSLLR